MVITGVVGMISNRKQLFIQKSVILESCLISERPINCFILRVVFRNNTDLYQDNLIKREVRFVKGTLKIYYECKKETI